MASAFRNSTPTLAPFPVATMIDMGVARPSAHGHAMIRTETALTSACAMRGSGPTSAQTTNASTAAADHGGHEVGGHGVGQALDRRAASLRFADHAHDLREQGVGADALGAHDEAAGRSSWRR